MDTKTKALLEDIFLLTVFACIIYGVYYFFFNEEEKIIKQTVKTNIIKEVQEDKEDKKAKKLEKIIEVKKEKIKEKKEIEEVKEIQKVEKIEKVEELEDKNLEDTTKQEDIKTKSTFQNHTKISSFYKELKTKIYSNIEKNISKDNILDKKNTSIRITILKDGNYEQLRYMKGSEEYYNSIKNSVLEIFPLQIPVNLKDKFPRYFRMEVEF